MGSVKYYTRFAVEIISRLLNYQSGNDCTLAFKKAASVSSSFVPRLSIWTPRSLWLWTNFFGRAKRAADKLVVLGTPRACSLSTRHTLHFHLTCTLHYKRHTPGRGVGGMCVGDKDQELLFWGCGLSQHITETADEAIRSSHGSRGDMM